MTVRVAFVDMIEGDWNGVNVRAIKYFKSKLTPSGITAKKSHIDAGFVDVAAVAADLTPAQITQAENLSDVLLLPEDLDTNLTSGAVITAAAALEAWNIPAGWVDTSFTYRQVLRIVVGMFQYLGRLTKLSNVNPFEASVNLSLTYGSLGATWQGWIKQAAVDIKLIDESTTVPSSWTVRQILEWMGQQWGDEPITFGDLLTV